MEIGVYHEFHCRPDQTSAAASRRRWDNRGGRPLGLDAIWLAEIHRAASPFGIDSTAAPSPPRSQRGRSA